MTELSYPIGRFVAEPDYPADRRAALIDEIAALPSELRAAVEGLDDEQLDTPYRPEGWTVRQVVHHVADSHINSFVRFKLALTETSPTIKPYDEAAWALLPDASAMPVAPSLSLLDAIHERWVTLLRALDDVDFARTFTHPDRGLVRLDVTLGLYAWHGRHHVAHVTSLSERMGWRARHA